MTTNEMRRRSALGRLASLDLSNRLQHLPNLDPLAENAVEKDAVRDE